MYLHPAIILYLRPTTKPGTSLQMPSRMCAEAVGNIWVASLLLLLKRQSQSTIKWRFQSLEQRHARFLMRWKKQTHRSSQR